MQCPFCFNEIKLIESCPDCGRDMKFYPEEGPCGTWECASCSTPELIIAFRRTPTGLRQCVDEVGRYALKNQERSTPDDLTIRPK